MSQVLNRDLADLTLAAVANAAATEVAGGTGDNVARVGQTLDRNAFGLSLGAMFLLGYTTVLSAAATLSIGTVKVEHSPDGTTWSTYKTFTDPGVVATGAGTFSGVVRLQADLGSAQRYIRLDYTPNLSATGTDTLNDHALVVFHGFDRLPPQLGSDA